MRTSIITIVLLIILTTLIILLCFCRFTKDHYPDTGETSNELYDTRKYFLALHTVFIANENIEYLDEYLKYHIHLGFEHFFLYDNDDSTGGGGTKTHNRYGIPISTTKNTPETIQKLNDISQKYSEYVTIVKWQPLDEQKRVMYGQNEACDHFVSTFGGDCEWVAFIDLDEFIVSRNNLDLPRYLESMGNKQVSCVKLTQKKFKDRHLSTQKYITQEFECIDKVIGTEWGPKNIVRMVDYIDIYNVHGIEVKHETVVAQADDLIFHHYNVNPSSLEWMTDFYKSDEEFSLNSRDSQLKSVEHLFNDDI